MSADFKKGFMVALGVMVALALIGLVAKAI
jgi:hypothetical protein